MAKAETRIPVPPHAVISEKAITAIEVMLDGAAVKAEPDGGLTWEIELDGNWYSMTVDRDGKVRGTASD